MFVSFPTNNISLNCSHRTYTSNTLLVSERFQNWFLCFQWQISFLMPSIFLLRVYGAWCLELTYITVIYVAIQHRLHIATYISHFSSRFLSYLSIVDLLILVTTANHIASVRLYQYLWMILVNFKHSLVVFIFVLIANRKCRYCIIENGWFF